MKLYELVPGVLVAVCGEEARIVSFLRVVRNDLERRGSDALLAVLAELAPAFVGTEPRFALMFGHLASGAHALTIFTTDSGVTTSTVIDPLQTFVLGSPPDALKDHVRLACALLRKLELDATDTQAAVVCFLQSLGVMRHLAVVGVGGAFFGACVRQGEIHWQEKIDYLIYPPKLLSNAPLGTVDAPFTAGSEDTGLEKVRVLTFNQAGVVVSSMSEDALRAFIPPSFAASAHDWEEALEREFPDPPNHLAPTRYVAFLAKGHRRAALLCRRQPALASKVFHASYQDGALRTGFHWQLTAALEAPVDDGVFEFLAITEDAVIQPRRIKISIEGAQ